MSYFFRENSTLEAKVEAYFSYLEEQIEQAGFPLSVVLLGSFSRGEGTWGTEPDGREIFLSDLEFFTVYPKGFSQFSAYEKMLKDAETAVFSDAPGSLFHIDNSYVRQDRMKRLEKKLLTFDATATGKTVVGADVMAGFPTVDIDNINMEDLRDILVHRIFSVLYYGRPLRAAGKTEQYRYSLAKNSLDLMTVLLAEKRILVSGFARKTERIRALPDVPERIRHYFEYCLSVKLQTECPYSFSTEEMEEIFLSLIEDLSRTFRLPLKNALKNLPAIARRRLGMLKRGLQRKKIVFSQDRHLRELIERYRSGRELTGADLTRNYVLNGYPVQS